MGENIHIIKMIYIHIAFDYVDIISPIPIYIYIYIYKSKVGDYN